MNTQDIKNALNEIEPEEAAQIALSFLRDHDYVVKAWVRDDVASIFDQDPESDNYTPEERERIIDLAFEDRAVQSLEDSTDQDWDAISQAVDDAMATVGLR